MAAFAPPSPTDEQQPVEQPDDAVAMFGDGLKKLVQEDIRTDLDPEKVYQLSEIRKFEYYWRGIQFLRRTITGGLVDWVPAVQNNSQGKDGNQNEDLYSYCSNDIRGYGRKFIGVIAQQPPNVKFEPNKKTSEEHIRRARKAQSVGDILRGLWNIKWLSQQAAFGFWKSGTQFIHTPFVADGDKYGISEEPVLVDQQVQLEPAKLGCMNCGQKTPLDGQSIPPQYCPCGQEFGPENFIEPETIAFPMPTGETTKYPNGCAEAHLYNGMYVSTPFSIRHLIETPYLMLEYEEYKGKLLAAYRSQPDIYKKLRSMRDSGDAEGSIGGYAESMARTTRDLSQSPSGTVILPHPNRWLYTRIWMRPSQYEMAKGRTPDGSDLRDGLLERFPDGLLMTIVQDEVIDIKPAVLDYEWVMAQPEAAENAYPDPICKDMISSQDLTNTCLNITAETLERQIPQTGVDVDMIDLTARKKSQLPASFIPMRRKGPGSLNDAVVKMAVAKTEPEMTQYPTLLREHSAEGVGITRSIFGAGEREQTAYATNLKRNQAMLQLGPALDALRALIAGAEQNGVRQMAMHSGGTIPSPHSPRSETEQIDGIEELTEGGWHAEAEDALPQSWSEKRAALMELMEKDPQALQSLGFMSIQNIPLMQDLLIGIEGWKVPNADALHKVNNQIRELLKSAPIQSVSQISGQPLLLPSIPVDDEDDHEFSAAALQEYLQTEEAWEENKKNPQGIANVRAFWRSQKGLSLPPPPPMGGPGPGASGAPPAPNSPGGPPSPGTASTGPQSGMAPKGGPPHLMPPPPGSTAGVPAPGAP